MSKPIRVVYLIGQFGMGGSERQLFLLLKHMDRERILPEVVVFNPSPNETYQGALEEEGIVVREIPQEARGIVRRGLWLYRYFRKVRPHVVHSWTVHDNPFAGIIGLLASIPVRLGSLRGSPNLDNFRSLPVFFRFLSLHSVTRLIVNSRSLKDELEKAGVNSKNIYVLTNCVLSEDAGYDSGDLSEFGIGPEHVVVGIVGNLRPVKNHVLFVRAMARVIATNSNVRAILVGHPITSCPGMYTAVAREISDLKMAGKIILAGFRADVPAVMKKLDIFCLTSDSEGLPNVILEAMAAGVPVVSTSVGGVPEIVADGENGLLVAARDEEGFAAAVSVLVEDADLRRRLGGRGREQVEEDHLCRRQADRLGQFYRRMVELSEQATEGISR